MFYSKNAGIFGCIKIVLKFISTSQCSIVKSKKIFLKQFKYCGTSLKKNTIHSGTTALDSKSTTSCHSRLHQAG